MSVGPVADYILQCSSVPSPFTGTSFPSPLAARLPIQSTPDFHAFAYEYTCTTLAPYYSAACESEAILLSSRIGGSSAEHNWMSSQRHNDPPEATTELSPSSIIWIQRIRSMVRQATMPSICGETLPRSDGSCSS